LSVNSVIVKTFGRLPARRLRDFRAPDGVARDVEDGPCLPPVRVRRMPFHASPSLTARTFRNPFSASFASSSGWQNSGSSLGSAGAWKKHHKFQPSSQQKRIAAQTAIPFFRFGPARHSVAVGPRRTCFVLANPRFAPSNMSAKSDHNPPKCPSTATEPYWRTSSPRNAPNALPR